MKNPLFSLLREFRWHLIAILILLTVRAQVPAEEGAIRIPTAVYALIDQADADVAKVHAALAVKLKKEQDVATKRGDLELAMWLKTKVESLQPSQAQQAAGATPKQTTWVTNFWRKGEELTVTKNRVERKGGSSGSWVMSKGTFTITWDNGGVTVCDAHDESDGSWKETTSGFKMTPQP